MAESFESLYQGEELAKQYLLYRPTYAKELYKFMVQYYEEGRGPDCNYHLAVDVGCGSGQATIPLAEYFYHVIGCDISKDQLSNAPKDVDRVEFKVSPSEKLAFLEENSVDIVTAATSFHWFDQELFYAEAKRVLKPGGVLSIFSWNTSVLDNTEGQKIFEQFVAFLDTYWRGTRYLDTVYRDYTLPFPESKGLFQNKSFSIRKQWGLSEFIGYLTSLHGWNLYIKENPDSDYLEQLRKGMALAYTRSGEETVLNVTFNLNVLIGRKPV